MDGFRKQINGFVCCEGDDKHFFQIIQFAIYFVFY